jgi:hypothetical protein
MTTLPHMPRRVGTADALSFGGLPVNQPYAKNSELCLGSGESKI